MQQDMDLNRADDGDTIIYTLVRPDQQPAARFYVRPGTTDEGFLALLNGDVDIALSLREPDKPNGWLRAIRRPKTRP
jgi:hypothetical protein